MGDLGIDTTPTGGDGVYRAALSREWEIWGPMGGYLASFALRAAGLHCGKARPANLVGHFLGVASFDEPITITCTSLRTARSAHSVRASITQGDRNLFEAMIWGVDAALAGLDHHDAPMPDVDDWRTLPSLDERFAAMGVQREAPYPFWENLDSRPVHWRDDWNERAPGDAAPEWTEWLRFQPTATFADPWVDACRLLILVDLGGWPATSNHHNTAAFIAPSIDLAIEFHHFDSNAEWLLTHSHAPVARDGLVGTRSRVWNDTGTLLASGVSHLLCRPMG